MVKNKNLIRLLSLIILLTLGSFTVKYSSLAQVGNSPPLVSFTPAQKQILDRLTTKQIIYLGETHDREADHQAQLAIIQHLQRRRRPIAIAMEMFQRPAQTIINNYLAGKITELELIEQTEYEKRWGFDWQYYAPILQYAKTHRLPVIALNTPTEITRQVAKQGLESLTPAQRQNIPPIADIDRTNNAYRDILFDIYRQHQQTATLNSKSFDRFYTAQLLWDETMAEGVANFFRRNPDRQLIVMAGKIHIIYGHGIPSRVTRRLQKIAKHKKFTQATVLLSTEKKIAQESDPKPGDFIWHILD
jgi:uncharacterized iron-regulated protein